MNTTRIVFSISFAVGVFWLLGFLIEPIIQIEPPIVLLSILSSLIAAIIIFIVFKISPDFLVHDKKSPIKPLKYYLLSFVGSYLILVPLCGVAAFIFIKVFGDITQSDSSIFITLFAIWFPLWWFVPLGLSIGWKIYKKKITLITSK
jgi:hypothetical protein